ncbi:hypothetical protein NDU88_000729 [Pleurodeles waltl]|uniref:Uncharacterized protein n=1 Tax=Pleurodeles waltl TaxID=8319 RepID=A0AAV7P1M4_PLEWA|nr:hypothetical protein NDU88_000729 [Pleurodeles waltl]
MISSQRFNPPPWDLTIHGAAGTRSHDDVLLIGRYPVSTARGKPLAAARTALQPRSRPRGSGRPGRVAPADVLLGSGLTGPRTSRSQLLHALQSLAIP